jgi:hypothetical protein
VSNIIGIGVTNNLSKSLKSVKSLERRKKEEERRKKEEERRKKKQSQVLFSLLSSSQMQKLFNH